MSKYDDERKKILQRMQKSNVSFTPESKNKSKYADEREALHNPPSRQTFHSPEPIDIIKPGQSLNPLQGTMDRVASLAKGSGAQKARDFVEAGKATRAAQDPSNKFLAGIKHNTVDLLGEGIDRLQVGATGFKPVDAVGKFINRFGQSAGQAVGVDTQAAKGAPILSTGSKIADKTADIAGSIAGPLTNPSNIGQGLMSGSLQIGKAAAQKLAPKAGPLLQRTIEGAIAGGVQGGVVSGVRGETSAKDVGKAVGLGAATGAIAEPILYGAGSALKNLFRKSGIPETEANEILGLPMHGSQTAPEGPLALPSSRSYDEIQQIRARQTQALPEPAVQGRMNAAASRSNQAYGSEPIVNQHTFELPEANPGTRQVRENVANARNELSSVDSEINQLATRYEQRVIDEYKYLKESMGQRAEPGVVIKDPMTGEVTDRVGSISNNPRWYQEISNKSNGYKKPSNKELYELARKRVDNGFQDEQGNIPSWREQEGYDQSLASLNGVREQIANGLKEIDPALNVTPDPIVGQALRDLRKAGQTKPQTIDAPFTAQADRTIQETPEQVAQRQAVGQQFVNDLSRQQNLSKPITGRLGAPGQRQAVTPQAAAQASMNGERPVTMNARLFPQERVGRLGGNPDPAQASSERSGQALGFSAFGKKAGAYDNLKTSTKSQLVTRQTKERLPTSELANRAYTQLVDDLHPLNLFDKAVQKVTGAALRVKDSVHKLALNSRGSDVITRQILTEKQVDSNGNVIGKSLKDILSQLPKNEHSYVDFEDYLINKHAITRMEDRGEKVFREELKWTPDVGRQIVADYEAAHPEFKTMSNEIYDFQQNMVQSWLVDTGLIPQAQADAYFKANPTYIPMKRFFSELEKGGGLKGGKSKKGIGNQSAPVKQYSKTGSERQVISPIESMIENVDAFVKSAKRNESMQAFARNLERYPEELDSFAEFVPETEIMGAQSLKNINATLQDEGIEGVVAKLGEDFDASYRKATQRGLDKDNIVRVMIDGKPKYIQVNDKPLLESITAMGPDASNVVMDFLGKVTGVFKTLTTGVNPVFSLTRNIMRDIPQAYAASKSTNNPITFMSDLAQSAYAIAKDKDLYQEYKNIGGGHSSPAAADRNLLAQSKRQILPQHGNKLKGIIPKGYDKLQNALNAVESAPRIGEFKRLAASGTPEDRQAGLAAANDVTVNFKRRGRLTKQLDKVFPYANAAAQGLDKTARMFKDAPAKAAAKTALAVGLPAMISYAINWNNPDYQKVSKQVKDNFYLLPKGDGTFYKIAKPKELGTVFADIPERLMQVFAQQDPEAFKDFASQIRTTFLPPGIQGAAKSGGITDRLAGVLGDTVIGPIADVYANKNFMGTPIVPGNLANLSPELQSDAKTSSLSKFIGEKTKTSPKALDYLFRQYTGVLGQLGQPLLSPGGDLGQSLVQQVTADPVFSNDIVDKFYNSKGKQDQAKTDYPITGKLPKGYNDGLRKYLGKITNAMGDIRKQMRAVESNKLMPAAQKREQLRSLQEQINQLAEQGNNAAKQVTK